jgi:hypothetical protein
MLSMGHVELDNVFNPGIILSGKKKNGWKTCILPF